MTAKRCGVTWRVPGERIQTRHLGRRSLAALAAGILLLAGGVDSASAQIGPSGTIVEFDYTLTNVSTGGFLPAVVYSTGVVENAGSSVELRWGLDDCVGRGWRADPTSQRQVLDSDRAG